MNKQERLAILFELDTLLYQLETASEEQQGELDQKIREIGKRLEAGITKDYHGKPLPMTIEEFIEYKRQGMPDKEIAKIYSVSIDKVSKWKRKNGIKRRDQRMDKVSLVLTSEEYEGFKEQGLSDKAVWELKGLSRASFQRWKREVHNGEEKIDVMEYV